MDSAIRILVWNEHIHEVQNPRVGQIYPTGIHGAIAERLGREPDMDVHTATLADTEHGLSEALLDQTDVLFWWGHAAHNKVAEHVVDRVQQAVLSGMGFVALHSAHFSRPFRRLMGTNGGLKWREAAEIERLWNLQPAHPITQGIGDYIQIPAAEMYGERFDIPEPDELIFISWFEGGEVFRSGCTWRRGNGRVFYFRPGHESYPIYHHPEVLQILVNAARWARPSIRRSTADAPNVPDSLSPIADRGAEYASTGIVQTREDIR